MLGSRLTSHTLQLIQASPADIAVQAEWILLFDTIRKVKGALGFLESFVDQVFLDAMVTYKEEASVLA